MNKIYMLFVSLLLLATLNACRPPFRHATYYIDYQQAGDGLVFITEANSVSFDYEPMGSVLVEEISGSVKITIPKTKKDRNVEDGIYGEDVATKTVTSYAEATAQSALNYAATVAIRLGGDGIINLKLSTYRGPHNDKIVVVSGMVIKRK